IIPFGLFGLEQYASRPVGGDAIANVGGARITQSELDQAVRQEAERYRAQFGANFDPAIMENPAVRRSILDRLVNDRLIAIGAVRSDVTVPDRQLAERI